MTPTTAAWILYTLGAAATALWALRKIARDQARDPLQICDHCRRRAREWRILVTALDHTGHGPARIALAIVAVSLAWPVGVPIRLTRWALGQQHRCSRTADKPQ